ncbi:hypothetical protein CMO83_01500 [Candidatus Woesearchaeota archaeon]|jgi:hypothetical protein|nr:hypothetical protein [Candidatus Woesearchaeota archaeon]MDP6647989.1 hypothetical protein [Candidatus Woesearchaeota archaeon]|tara:strand:- start:26948 stop:27358 length:411 start_codon:yes stop_codon:yes gene_type:complete
MKISIDTKEDSHEELRKVINMLQNLVGESQETFTNQPESGTSEPAASPFANIFGDTASPPPSNSSDALPQSTPAPESQASSAETPSTTQPEGASESTEELFADLFSKDELKKMDKTGEKKEVKNDDSKDNTGVQLY